jgi:hypothetical protein
MGLCVAPTCASREEFQGISGQCAVPSSRQGNVFLPSEHFICGVRASHYYNYNNMYIHMYIVIYIYPFITRQIFEYICKSLSCERLLTCFPMDSYGFLWIPMNSYGLSMDS